MSDLERLERKVDHIAEILGRMERAIEILLADANPSEWHPCGHIPGYEQRVDEHGSLHTRPIGGDDE